MDVFNLPNDIFPAWQKTGSGITMHHYTAKSIALKEMAVLQANAVSLVIKGSKTMHFLNGTVNVQDSEIHILSAGNCIASVSLSKPFESILIFFESRVLADFCLAHSEQIEKLKRGLNISPESYVAFKKDDFIRNYIQSLLLMLPGEAGLSESMKQLKLQELLLYLLENHTGTFLSFQSTEKPGNIESRIRKVVEDNKLNNLNLDELAFLCNMSTSTFKRHFKHIYSSSPTQWLNEQKMLMAYKLLNDQGEKPGDIWFQLGFETHTGFTRSFKKRFGKLPKDLTLKS
jgi:AraC-like DNA-binding protein